MARKSIKNILAGRKARKKTTRGVRKAGRKRSK